MEEHKFLHFWSNQLDMGMTDAKLGFTKIGFLYFLLFSPLLGKNYFGTDAEISAINCIRKILANYLPGTYWKLQSQNNRTVLNNALIKSLKKMI